MIGTLLALALLPSCHYSYQAYVSSPSVGELDAYAASPSAWKSAPASRKVTTRELAISHCRESMEHTVPEIRLTLDYGDLQTELNAICHYMLDSGLAVALETEATGKKVTMRPEYSDCVLMLRAHEDEAWLPTLSEQSRYALRKAQQIVNEVCLIYDNDYDRAVALHDYIILHTRYESKLGIAARADATTKLLLEGVAVCDGYAHCYGMLLSMAGIENKFLVGKGDGIEHIWNLVRLNGEWTHVDITYNDPKPDKKGRVMHTYFGMSDARISSNHEWSRAAYPAATSDAHFYLFRKNLRFATVRDLLHWSARVHPYTHWEITVYVDELADAKSDSVVYDKVQDIAESMHISHLRSIAVDKGCRAALYCVFGH